MLKETFIKEIETWRKLLRKRNGLYPKKEIICDDQESDGYTINKATVLTQNHDIWILARFSRSVSKCCKEY